LLAPSVYELRPKDSLARFGRETVGVDPDPGAILSIDDEESGLPPLHPAKMTASPFCGCSQGGAH
jgi:hypothetical protein